MKSYTNMKKEKFKENFEISIREMERLIKSLRFLLGMKLGAEDKVAINFITNEIKEAENNLSLLRDTYSKLYKN